MNLPIARAALGREPRSARAVASAGIEAAGLLVPPMEKTAYRIVLDQFHIDTTRAPDEDTDAISLTGQLDGQDLPTLDLSTGDVDNGDHLINLQWDPIETDQMSHFELKFAIYNSGHANEEAFRKKLDDALTAAAGAAAPLSGYASAFIVIAKALIDLFDFDCDGLVAGDLMRASGADLAQLTINWPHIFHITRGYPGTDSAVGCGSNSQYSVSWYVQRLNPAEPRLDLLVHLQNYGDRTWHENQFAGTRHEHLRVEGFALQVVPPVAGLTLRYMAHLQGIGDTAWVNEGEFIGTRGESRRLEGFAVRLEGPAAAGYYVQYTGQVQGRGETGPILDGAFCGTRGQSLPLEGMTVSVRPMPTTGPS
jgi:Clostridial hydrophobic W